MLYLSNQGYTLLQALVERLHSVLRPFLLRRLKRDVEKSLPGKHEHIIRCRLSKRQRTLYEDYMAASDVRNTLSSGNFLGIINVLMQLRKVRHLVQPTFYEWCKRYVIRSRSKWWALARGEAPCIPSSEFHLTRWICIRAVGIAVQSRL